MTAVLKNEGDSTITIKGIRLQKGTLFRIVSGDAPPEFNLDAGATRDIVIAYTPDTESLLETIRDKDSIEVITECDTNAWYVHGRGVIPKIMVEDWDAGAVLLGTKVCKEAQTGTGLRISNPGTDTLIITNFKDITAPFELSTPYTPATPIAIAPKGEVWLVTPCYTPPDINTHSIDVTLESNAGSGDSVSNWRGRGIVPGPYVTSYDFGNLRVNSLREGKVYVRNKGNAPVSVTTIKLRDGNLGFSIKPGSILPEPTVVSPIELNPEDAGFGTIEIELTVVYNPQLEGNFTDDVVALFEADENIPDGSIYNWVKGSAYLPQIILKGYEFNPPIVSGTTHPATGEVIIYSTSTYAPLYIDEIRWRNPAQAEFSWVTAPPSKFSLGMGDSLKLPVKFHPTKVGTITEPVDVVNDANPVPDSIITTSADVIGHAYLQGVTVTDINYGNKILCDSPVMSIFVENTGSGDVTIDSLVLQNGDITNFRILNATFPEILTSTSSKEYQVQFLPNQVGGYYAEIKVYTSLPLDPVATLRGTAYDANITLLMTKYDASLKLGPGYKIRPEITAKLDLPADAKVTYLQFEIIYNAAWMMYDKSIDKGSALDGTWTVTAQEMKIDNVKNKLVITCQGTNPINLQSGVVAIPRFLLLLSDVKEFIPDFANITVGSRDICVNKLSVPGQVVLNTCVIDLRGVVTSTTHYQLYDIEPNPASGSDVTIKYSVPFDGFTRIDLVDTKGELVGVLVNEEVSKGNHELLLPTSALSSGLYLIRMSSGKFADTKQLIINK